MSKEARINDRLDLYNQLLKVCDTMNEENESLFVLTTSPDGGNFSCLTGNIDLLGSLICVKENLSEPSLDQIEKFNSLQGFILNTAMDIIVSDKEKRDIFTNALFEYNESVKLTK
jgi:hypothetical protein